MVQGAPPYFCALLATDRGTPGWRRDLRSPTLEKTETGCDDDDDDDDDADCPLGVGAGGEKLGNGARRGLLASPLGDPPAAEQKRRWAWRLLPQTLVPKHGRLLFSRFL